MILQGLTSPYRIPLPEPEPEPVQRRLSRRLISTKNQNIIAKPMNTTTIITTTQRPLTLATTALASVTDRRTNILKLLEQSFPDAKPKENTDFNEIFEEAASPNPWAINSAQFDIIPAVPFEDVAESLTVKNKEEENPAPVPRQFIPVPAVPDNTQDIERQPKKVFQLNSVDIIENSGTNPNKVSPTRQCFVKCTEQFCLPNSDLSKYASCEGKCKTFCE